MKQVKHTVATTLESSQLLSSSSLGDVVRMLEGFPEDASNFLNKITCKPHGKTLDFPFQSFEGHFLLSNRI